jgi:hypothetical protein
MKVILRQALIAIATAALVVAMADLFIWVISNTEPEPVPETQQAPTSAPDEGQHDSQRPAGEPAN